jgi:DNA-directed RNA polymerase specialized sigma subunit
MVCFLTAMLQMMRRLWEDLQKILLTMLSTEKF